MMTSLLYKEHPAQKKCYVNKREIKAIFIYQAMTLTKDSVLWNGLPQSGNIASPTFGEKIRNPLNLSLNLHLSNMSDLILRQFTNALSHCNIQFKSTLGTEK
jgi:hypothetical protein